MDFRNLLWIGLLAAPSALAWTPGADSELTAEGGGVVMWLTYEKVALPEGYGALDLRLARELSPGWRGLVTVDLAPQNYVTPLALKIGFDGDWVGLQAGVLAPVMMSSSPVVRAEVLPAFLLWAGNPEIVYGFGEYRGDVGALNVPGTPSLGLGHASEHLRIRGSFAPGRAFGTESASGSSVGLRASLPGPGGWWAGGTLATWVLPQAWIRVRYGLMVTVPLGAPQDR